MNSTEKIEELQAAIASFEESNGSLEVKAASMVAVDRGESPDGRGVTQRWVKWTWRTYVHSPLYYDNVWIQVWEDGTWKHGCHVENRSRHSDWDIWIDLYIKNPESGTVAFVLRNRAWFQDLDSGEDWNKDARGFSRDVYDLFDAMYNGTLAGSFTTHKRRDN